MNDYIFRMNQGKVHFRPRKLDLKGQTAYRAEVLANRKQKIENQTNNLHTEKRVDRKIIRKFSL